MILVTSAAGQNRGSGNHEEAIADGLPGSQAGNAQNCLKLRILSLLHVSIPGQLKMGTETLLLKPIFTNSCFLLKKKQTKKHIQYTLLCLVKWSEVAQSCLTLCDPMDCSLPGSSVHGILQAIVLEWIAISFSRGSSQPRARTWVSHTVDRHFTVWATREARCTW